MAEQRQANIHVRDGISEDEFVAMRTRRDATLGMPTLILPAIQVNIRAGHFPPAEDNGVRYLKIPVDALRPAPTAGAPPGSGVARTCARRGYPARSPDRYASVRPPRTPAMFAEAEADPSLSKEAFAIEARLRVALLNAQYQRLQKAEKSLLVVVAGIDGAGKGATVNLLNEWMDPRHQDAGLRPARRRGAGTPLAVALLEGPARQGQHRHRVRFLVRAAARDLAQAAQPGHHRGPVRRHPPLRGHADRRGVQIVKLWFHLSADAQRRAPSAF